MIRRLLIIPMLALGLVFAAAAPAAAATASDFRGVWSGIDGDESNLTMFIVGGGTTMRVVYYDDSASVCDGLPALLTTSATLAGDTLSGDLSGFCVDGSRIGALTEWTYHADGNTLTDNHGATYSRP